MNQDSDSHTSTSTPPENSIEVSIQDAQPPSSLVAIEAFCHEALTSLAVTGWEVSILFCDDTQIAVLNETYRGKTGPTDVLSFSQEENPPHTPADFYYAGDIVISVPALLRNATEYGFEPHEELARLLVHGLLHLAGYDHEGDDPAQEMLVLQEQILLDTHVEILG